MPVEIFDNLKKFSHNTNFDICPLNSENVEIYSPIYHAIISKEDFFARISFQSELNQIFYYDLQTVKKGNYRDVMFRNRRRANYMSISIVHGKANSTYNKSILDDFSILFDYR